MSPTLAGRDALIPRTVRLSGNPCVEAVVLFVRGGPVDAVRNYLERFFCVQGVFPQIHEERETQVCTLASTECHRHLILKDHAVSKIVRLFCGSDSSLELYAYEDNQSLHFITLKDIGAAKMNLQALVYFKDEPFMKTDLTLEGTQRLNLRGLAPSRPVSFESIMRIEFDHPSHDFSLQSTLHNTIGLNNKNSCWFAQVVNALACCIGKPLFAIFDCINGLTDEEMETLKRRMETASGGIYPMECMYKLFLLLHKWLKHCNDTQRVIFVDQSVLKVCFVANPCVCNLFVTAHSMASQEDVEGIVARVIECFKLFSSELAKFNLPQLVSTLGEDGNDINRCWGLATQFIFDCSHCQTEVTQDSKIETISVYPHDTDFSSVEKFEYGCCSLNSTYDDIICWNCGHVVRSYDVKQCKYSRAEAGTRFAIAAKLKGRGLGSTECDLRSSWVIPEKTFRVGPNIVMVEYCVLNFPYDKYGASGHYSGVSNDGHFLYLHDDGSPPVPIADMQRINNNATLLVCKVIGVTPEASYAEFEQSIQSMQTKQHKWDMVEKITKFREGIEDNLYKAACKSTENRNHSLEALNAARNKVNILLERIKETEDVISKVDSDPEYSEEPYKSCIETEKAKIQVFRQMGSALQEQLTSS